MSLNLPQAPNAGLFKQGYTTHSSADGAIIRNIQACNEISLMVATSIGPCGRNKIIVNHLGKIFITNDAATILNELDVVHPAVKILIMASKQQDYELGDFSNFIICFAGELLKNSEKMLVLGLSPMEIIQGYKMANNYVMEHLQDFTVDRVEDVFSKNSLMKLVKPVVAAKQYGNEGVISLLIIDAVHSVLNPKNPNSFNVDSIRVVKIMGSSLAHSQVIKGMVFPQEPESHKKSVSEGRTKVAVYTCPIDISATETKGTVLLHNAQEMLDFTSGEELQIEAIVKEIHASGVRVIIAGSSVSEIFLHYLNKYGFVVLKVGSKFDLRRICRVCGASPLARLGAPMPEEMGAIDFVETKEIGSDRVTIFRQDTENANSRSLTATIIVRGATTNNLDDIERAIDDGISSLKGLLKDASLLPGAGSVEIQLINKLTAWGEKQPGLLQLAIKAFAQSLEVIPRSLAETAGLNATETLSNLYAAASAQESVAADARVHYGVDVDQENENGIVDVTAEGVYDLLISKKSAISLATDAATTVLSVDSIIMAKRAGGPSVPKQARPGNWDQAD
ncbi:hypothetical protein BABINDRAFT_67172 [Babjeviella inositovora NRRL Y-12698]|uniref:CCT-theta n=1 Tax=Babjeviella inositovora NRRL Y-12698 TaxID=984486 RepID=A0A1E3QIF7_9ASCO|nr:uncharacterized protein BABINDRAFT_67172 [Babjeviella inositovora NRRL Y-12698]ODQ77479.1 hypothetical protein BABINDRAFT_67172 [Babjeviella inositovora NRRL Y-12698]